MGRGWKYFRGPRISKKTARIFHLRPIVLSYGLDGSDFGTKDCFSSLWGVCTRVFGKFELFSTDGRCASYDFAMPARAINCEMQSPVSDNVGLNGLD